MHAQIVSNELLSCDGFDKSREECALKALQII